MRDAVRVVQVGLPDHAEVAEAVLDYKLKASGGDVRSFLTAALEDRAEASGELAGVADEIFAAIDAVEQEQGPLSPDNSSGFQALAKRVEVRFSWASCETCSGSRGLCYLRSV